MRKVTDAGFTLIELLMVVALIGIMAAIAIPGLLRARMSANETSAIASLRVVNSAQNAYMTTCGNGFYASTLPILADPAPVGTPFISPDLGSAASINKSGYRLTMGQGSEATSPLKDGCNPTGIASALASSYWTANAPLVAGQTGSRYFWSNTLGTVFASTADDFAAITIGNSSPGVGTPIQ